MISQTESAKSSDLRFAIRITIEIAIKSRDLEHLVLGRVGVLHGSNPDLHPERSQGILWSFGARYMHVTHTRRRPLHMYFLHCSSGASSLKACLFSTGASQVCLGKLRDHVLKSQCVKKQALSLSLFLSFSFSISLSLSLSLSVSRSACASATSADDLGSEVPRQPCDSEGCVKLYIYIYVFGEQTP